MSRKKKILCCVTLVACLLLVACGKSQAAQQVDGLISSIGEVSLESKDAIEEAEGALLALEEKEREQVENEELLIEARSTYNVLHVEKCISDIGEVSEESETAIKSAKEAYEELSEKERALVKNIDKLSAAEQNLKEIHAEKVVSAINALGTITLENKEKLEDTELAYYGLSKEEKNLVSNYDILEKAIEQYEILRKKEYDGAVSRMRVKYDEVREITFYTPKRVPRYTNSRSCMCPYIGMKGSSNWMKLRFNYAGSDWVFFEEVTIAVDEERYYKTFDYSDIQHDVGGRMVGEKIDIDPSSADISMLREIVNSKKTIIRFEGDEHYRDYTLNDADKAAIRDVLIMYDYLNN